MNITTYAEKMVSLSEVTVLSKDKGIPIEEFLAGMEDVVIMGSEPMPNMTIDDARKWYEAHKNEAGLAEIYANVENKAFWLAEFVDDYKEGTKEYDRACEVSDEWWILAVHFRDMIFDILRNEGYEITEHGYFDVLKIFMERNGYKDGAGWWVKKSRA